MKRILCSLFMLALIQPAFAQRKYTKIENSALKISTTQVAGGTFDLGSDDESKDRKPAHTVKLNDFRIGTFEITQAQWMAVMGNNPSTFKCDDCPVNNVSWNDAQAFIEKLNSMTGKHYRLPTEAEWEYAARGGANERMVRFAGKKLPQDIGWSDNNSKDRIHKVGLKKPNELGIYDMSGNVEEWCSDYYATSYGSKNDAENPQGPASGKARVIRGGSWKSAAEDMSVTRRAGYLPDTHSISAGFRVVED